MGERNMFDGDFGELVQAGDERSIEGFTRHFVLNKLRRSKVLLFRGFGCTTEEFVRFSDGIGSSFLTYQGGAYLREKVAGQESVFSVTGGTTLKMAIPPHGEMHYKGQKPALLWFFCETPPVEQGETTLFDGEALFGALRAETKAFFLAHKLLYLRSYSRETWPGIFHVQEIEQAQPFFERNGIDWDVDAAGNVTTRYLSSAVLRDAAGQPHFVNNILPVWFQERSGLNASLVRTEDGSPLPGDIIEELLRVSERLMIKIAWQTGDLLLIDNFRVMHGRTAICDDRRNILVRMSESE